MPKAIPQILCEREVDHPRIGATVLYFQWRAPGEEKAVAAIRIRRRRRVLVERVFPSAGARSAFANRWLAGQYMDSQKPAKMEQANRRNAFRFFLDLCGLFGRVLGRPSRKRRRTVKIQPWDI
jgi:hypothetical protein